VVSPVRDAHVRAGTDVRTRPVVSNAAVTASMGGSPPGAGPGPFGSTGPMMLAGQDLVGNQAVAAQAQQQPGKKPEPGPKAKGPPLTPRLAQKDTKGTEDRPDSGTKKKEAAGGVAGRQADGMGPARPERLSLPSFAHRFNAPTTLPPMRADAADREALAKAGQAFTRLVERSRRAHDAQLSLLTRTGRAALDRHDRVDSRTRSRVAQGESELDELRTQALDTVDTAYEQGVVGLDLAVQRSRKLVASASAGALTRLRSNADTAGDQVTKIVNDLASGYTTLLEQSAVEITDAAGQAISAVTAYGASAATLFPGGETPWVEAENEARRTAVPGLAKAAVTMLGEASKTQSTAYRDQIPVVVKQFSESELATALNTRKNEIDTKGRAAVEKATRTAYGALTEQAASGRKELRRMADAARKSIELRHRAARSRLTNDASRLLQASHAQTDAELTGLETAATTGLPAFERMIIAVHEGLEEAAKNGADNLCRSVEKAAKDTGPKVDQLGVAQQRMVTRADTSTGASMGEAERAAILALGRARAEAAGALRETGKGSARGIHDFVKRHDASFAATARGVRQVADAWAMPLKRVFGDAISKTKEAMTGPFNEWKKETDEKRKDFIGKALTPYLKPGTALASDIETAADKVAADLETRESNLEGAFEYTWGTDENAISTALRGLTPTQGRAVRWLYESKHGSLEAELRDELSGKELESALAYLRGDQVAGAAAELEASTGFFGDDEERIEQLMRNLTPEELSRLKGSKEGAEALADVRDSLGGTDLKVFDALAAGDQDLADAFRMKDEIDKARQSADTDALHDVLIKYGKEPTERGRAPATADQRRVAVQRELAGIIGGTPGGGAAITPQQAAAAVEKYALAPIEVVVAGPEGTSQVETREITGANRDLAVALIQGGENTVEARAARLGVETQRAGGPNMLKLDAALVDPRLKPGANVSKEEREQALADRNRVIQKYAASYGGADKAGTAASATAYLEGRLRAAYGDDKDAGDLAVRLAHEEYPTPKTAALAVKYASKGAGTDEELMFRFVERMDRDEIAAMRVEFKNITGTALDDELGTFGGEGMFTELSGDERLRMEVALLGVPRNDRERAEVAAFRIQQQREETGGLGSWLAEDSLADRSLDVASSRLTASLGGATVRVDDKGNPVWTDAAGRPTAPGGTAFDETGKYAGKDPREFASAVRVSKLAAENYAAKIDSYATYLTTAVMVIGAVAAAVATVATGGGASPLLLAAIAGLTGLSSMAVHSAVSGGRYGWEQAAVDLGMTAVQALTAGVGQHLSIVARGGTQSLAAGMTTLRSVQNLGNTMGGITGSALGDLVVIGGATGGLGGFGGALLDENTWSKGFGPGFAALLEATLTGALAGAASTVTSQAFESLPVGRAGAGGPRPTLGDALSRSLPGRAGLRVTSSFLGGAAGAGAQMGAGALTGSFKGDGGDILAAMGEAGLQSAVEESAAGPVEGPVQRAQQARNLRRGVGHDPFTRTGERPDRLPDRPRHDGPNRPPSLADLPGPVRTRDEVATATEFRAALGSLGNRVGVTIDPDLPGRTVRVHYDIGAGGLITNVRMIAGPSATLTDIRLHAPTARTMLRYGGLSGRVRQLLRQMTEWAGINGSPPVGTRAWEARLELRKLRDVIADRARAYADADPAARAELEAELAALTAQVDVHADTLNEWNLDPGLGYVAADSPLPPEIPRTRQIAQVPETSRRMLRDLRDAGLDIPPVLREHPSILRSIADDPQAMAGLRDLVENGRDLPDFINENPYSLWVVSQHTEALGEFFRVLNSGRNLPEVVTRNRDLWEQIARSPGASCQLFRLVNDGFDLPPALTRNPDLFRMVAADPEAMAGVFRLLRRQDALDEVTQYFLISALSKHGSSIFHLFYDADNGVNRLNAANMKALVRALNRFPVGMRGLPRVLNLIARGDVRSNLPGALGEIRIADRIQQRLPEGYSVSMGNLIGGSSAGDLVVTNASGEVVQIVEVKSYDWSRYTPSEQRAKAKEFAEQRSNMIDRYAQFLGMPRTQVEAMYTMVVIGADLPPALLLTLNRYGISPDQDLGGVPSRLPVRGP
jgi:hypothetical protein